MIDYAPPYIEETDTIEGYIEGVRASLQYWLDVHTDREAWAASWLLGGEYSATELYEQGQHEISNDYFTFDWRSAALKLMANNFQQCSECGSMAEQGYSYCECDDPELEDFDPEDFVWYARDIEMTPGEYELEQALITAGFDTYRAALEPLTCGIEEEAKEILARFDAAETNEDLLIAALAGTAVWHVHGNIVSDYGDRLGLDYSQVDSIRNDGLESWFDSEDIEEFTGG